MIKVEKSANTLDDGIKNLMAGAKLDYEKFHKVKSTLRLYKILVFFVLSQKKTLNILKKVIY
jgi:hypothetical protein